MESESRLPERGGLGSRGTQTFWRGPDLSSRYRILMLLSHAPRQFVKMVAVVGWNGSLLRSLALSKRLGKRGQLGELNDLLQEITEE